MPIPLREVVAEIQASLKSSPWFDWSSATADRDAFLGELIQKQMNKLDAVDQTRLQDEFFGVGPIAQLIQDPSITEIIINGPSQIWIERNGRLTKTADEFLSDLTYTNFIHYLCRQMRIPYSVERPFICGSWNQLRIHLVGEAITQSFAAVTIRKASEQPWTLERLEELSWCTSSQAELLRELVLERKNILVVGSTGSGKTAALSAIARKIASDQRNLILEDTSELPLPNLVSQKLLVREDPQRLLPDITLSDLVRQSLRMRPDRLIVGEVRGPEAKDLLMALSTGHAGSMGTLHAQSAGEALLRLEMLIQLGAPQWSLPAVRRLIFLSLNTIVVVGREESGSRKLQGIFKIASVEDFGFCVERMDAPLARKIYKI